MPSAGTVNVQMDLSLFRKQMESMTTAATTAASAFTGMGYQYETVQSRIYVPAPPIQADLSREEKWLIGPRPVPDFPYPIFVGDYLHGLMLPSDWDPNGHMEGENEWQNRSGFFEEAGFLKYKRLPVVPRLP